MLASRWRWRTSPWVGRRTTRRASSWQCRARSAPDRRRRSCWAERRSDTCPTWAGRTRRRGRGSWSPPWWSWRSAWVCRSWAGDAASGSRSACSTADSWSACGTRAQSAGRRCVWARACRTSRLLDCLQWPATTTTTTVMTTEWEASVVAGRRPGCQPAIDVVATTTMERQTMTRERCWACTRWWGGRDDADDPWATRRACRRAPRCASAPHLFELWFRRRKKQVNYFLFVVINM